MNLFFSPEVNSYQVLAPQYQVFEIIETLLETGNVEFELSSVDDASDPFFLITSRVKSLKNKVLKILEIIQNKYNEEITPLSEEEKKKTIANMK